METVIELDKKSALEFIDKYWEDTPPIKSITKERFAIMDAQVRHIIVRLMREGIEDEIEDVVKKRHVISAQELLPLVNQEREVNLTENDDNSQIRMSTIYYHLDILIEADLVREVLQIKEGRHKTKYFGRTAKLFLLDNKDAVNSSEKKEIIENFTKALNVLNPGTDAEGITQMLNIIAEKQIEIGNSVFNWLEDNKEILDKGDVNLHMLAESTRYFIAYSDEIIKLQKQINDLMHLDVG